MDSAETSEHPEAGAVTTQSWDAKLNAYGIEGPDEAIKEPEDQVAWAAQQLQLLAPLSVRQLKRVLLYGTNKEVTEIARDVLNRIGLKEEKGSRAPPPVIVLLPEAVANLPWATKKKLQAEVVDGEIVTDTHAQK